MPCPLLGEGGGKQGKQDNNNKKNKSVKWPAVDSPFCNDNLPIGVKPLVMQPDCSCGFLFINIIISGPAYTRWCTNDTREGGEKKMKQRVLAKKSDQTVSADFTRKCARLTHTFPEVGNDPCLRWQALFFF